MAFLLKQEAAKKFYGETKISLTEIVKLLNFMGNVLQKASQRGSFVPLTLPNTPIRNQIKNLFCAIAQIESVST